MKKSSLLLMCAVLTMFAIQFVTMQRLQSANSELAAWVDHTHKVIEVTDNYLKAMLDSETGQRGFLLTGKEAYLTPYKKGQVDATERLMELQQLTADNLRQQVQLSTLSQLHQDKLSELQQTIILFKNNQRELAIDLVNQDIGKQIMDDIRATIWSIRAEEDALLAIRQETFTNNQMYYWLEAVDL